MGAFAPGLAELPPEPGWVSERERTGLGGARTRAVAWVQAHPVLLRRLTRIRTILLWLSLAWLLVLYVARPELREALQVALSAYWLLLTWFWMSRTKTVSWRLVATFYSICIPWSIAVAFISRALAHRATAHEIAGLVVIPGNVNDLGSASLIAGVGEESAKLLPIVLLSFFMAGRVRRFAVVDWLLMGFAGGLAFQVSEELARRTVLQVSTPGLLDVLLGTADSRGPTSGYAQYSLSPLGGWSQWVPGTQFPGHHATTALVTVVTGFGLVAWRHAPRASSAASRIAWRSLGVLAPLVMWWLVVSVHAGGNATTAVQDRWLTSEHPSFPWLIRTGWTVAHHGVGLRWLLFLLLLVALVADARHLRRGDETPLGVVLTVPFTPALLAQQWSTRFLSTDLPVLSQRIARSGLTTAAYVWRDLVYLLAAHAAQPGEPRGAALRRARLAMKQLREVRTEQISRHLALTPSRALDRLRVRLIALTLLALLLGAFLALAPHWAHQVGTSPDVQSAEWFARLLDALGQWWSGLSPGGKIAVGAGIAAVVVLSGGSLGLGLGVSGVGTYLLGHGRGAATFVEDPASATRSYLARTTPLGLVADTGEAVLTFLPANFAGALGGRLVRNSIEGYVENPRAWREARVAWGDETGAINLDAFSRREPIELADGSMHSALTPAQEQEYRTWWNGLPVEQVKRRPSPEMAYQEKVYGTTEERIATTGPGPRERTIPDGSVSDYGAVGDAKFRKSSGPSFYVPDSMSPKFRGIAIRRLTERMMKYEALINDPANPVRALEIATNDPAVAAAAEEMMRSLNITGYVRIVE